MLLSWIIVHSRTLYCWELATKLIYALCIDESMLLAGICSTRDSVLSKSLRPQGRSQLWFSVKCSFLEIYNETITDLLRPGSGNLNLREDMKRGCYVDNLTEEIVLNGE